MRSEANLRLNECQPLPRFGSSPASVGGARLRSLPAPSGLLFPPGDPRLFSAGQETVESLLPELAAGEAPKVTGQHA